MLDIGEGGGEGKVRGEMKVNSSHAFVALDPESRMARWAASC